MNALYAIAAVLGAIFGIALTLDILIALVTRQTKGGSQ